MGRWDEKGEEGWGIKEYTAVEVLSVCDGESRSVGAKIGLSSPCTE